MGGTSCVRGTTGSLCAACDVDGVGENGTPQPKFYMWQTRCIECPEGSGWLEAVLVVIAAVVFMLAVDQLVPEKPSTDKVATSSLAALAATTWGHIQISITFFTLSILRWPSEVQALFLWLSNLVFFNLTDLSRPECQDQVSDPETVYAGRFFLKQVRLNRASTTSRRKCCWDATSHQLIVKVTLANVMRCVCCLLSQVLFVVIVMVCTAFYLVGKYTENPQLMDRACHNLAAQCSLCFLLLFTSSATIFDCDSVENGVTIEGLPAANATIEAFEELGYRRDGDVFEKNADYFNADGSDALPEVKQLAAEKMKSEFITDGTLVYNLAEFPDLECSADNSTWLSLAVIAATSLLFLVSLVICVVLTLRKAQTTGKLFADDANYITRYGFLFMRFKSHACIWYEA